MPTLPDGTQLPYPGEPGGDQLAAILAQLGGPGGGQQPPQDTADVSWLETAINAVHSGMVEEKNPKQISLLGAILNQLTTFQSNRASGPPQGQGG